jgi:hypothetical protein
MHEKASEYWCVPTGVTYPAVENFNHTEVSAAKDMASYAAMCTIVNCQFELVNVVMLGWAA